MLIYNGQIIAGGGTIVLPMTRAEYEANKAILDSADVWVDLTDEPDAIATADQVAFWVGQTQKSVGYIGDIATKALAKVEPTDTALYLHEVGTYFINKDGNMCMTDLQIAIGGTIVLDANCHVLSNGLSNGLPKLSNKVETSTVTPVLELNTTQVGEVTSNVYTVTQDCLGIIYWSHQPSGTDSQFLVYINSVLMIQIRTKVTDDAEGRTFPFRLFAGDTVQLKSVNGCHATLSIRNYI